MNSGIQVLPSGFITPFKLPNAPIPNLIPPSLSLTPSAHFHTLFPELRILKNDSLLLIALQRLNVINGWTDCIVKNLTLGSILVFVLSACSHKTENNPARTPQFHITSSDVTSVSVQPMTIVKTGRKLADLEVVLSREKAAEYHQFTQEHLNQRVQVLVGTNLIVDPWVYSADSSGRLETSFSRFEEAQTLADLLTKK